MLSENLNLPQQGDYGSSVLSVILSLFVFPFEKKCPVSFWDQEHLIFEEGIVLYKELLSCVENKTPHDKNDFSDVFEKIIAPYASTISSPTPAFSKWFDHVKGNSLHEVGIYWFEPECIFNSVLQFVMQHVGLKESNLKVMDRLIKEVDTFLQDVLCTYSQNHTDIDKRMRINIFFNHFCSKLAEDERKQLITLIIGNRDLKPKPTERFLLDSIHYINIRLATIMTAKEETAFSFFPFIRQKNKINIPHTNFKLKGLVDLDKSMENQKNLCDVIDEFMMLLKKSKEHYKTDYYEEMMSFLTSLTSPILTLEQKQNADVIGELSNFDIDYNSNY